VLGRLWVYCSKWPQGFSTFTEGGRWSKLNPLEVPMRRKFRPSAPACADVYTVAV
jgi:hypothetical protein